jgi:hypothetical protein
MSDQMIAEDRIWMGGRLVCAPGDPIPEHIAGRLKNARKTPRGIVVPTSTTVAKRTRTTSIAAPDVTDMSPPVDEPEASPDAGDG